MPASRRKTATPLVAATYTCNPSGLTTINPPPFAMVTPAAGSHVIAPVPRSRSKTTTPSDVVAYT